jgi:hypothetical protein
MSTTVATAATAGSAGALPEYDWEAELASDPRLKLVDEYMHRIMTRNFPGEAERYAPRPVAPASARYAPAPPGNAQGSA